MMQWRKLRFEASLLCLYITYFRSLILSYCGFTLCFIIIINFITIVMYYYYYNYYNYYNYFKHTVSLIQPIYFNIVTFGLKTSLHVLGEHNGTETELYRTNAKSQDLAKAYFAMIIIIVVHVVKHQSVLINTYRRQESLRMMQGSPSI